MEQAFPGLRTAPGGAIIAAADNLLDLSGPGRQLTSEMSLRYSQRLIEQIRSVDRDYNIQSLGFPNTLEGQAAQINDLRLDRAVALYRKRGELRPIQVEAVRFAQRKANRAYDEAVALAKARRLPKRLSEREAIGSYVDHQVRNKLRLMLRQRGITERSDPQIVSIDEHLTLTSAPSPFPIHGSDVSLSTSP